MANGGRKRGRVVGGGLHPEPFERNTEEKQEKKRSIKWTSEQNT